MHPTRIFLSALLAGLFLATPSVQAAFPPLALKPVALKQIHSPTAITFAPDGSGRLFVCDQPGLIYIIQGGMMLPTPFLDISATAANVADRKVIGVNTGYSERGLLCIVFHPGYANPSSPGYRKFYLNYNKTYVAGVDPTPNTPGSPADCVTVIAEFQVSLANPNVALPSSERRMLLYTQPQSNHKGGQLDFGPEIGPGGERYLYLGVGDGGSQQDNNLGHTGGNNTSPRPTNGLGNAQDKTRLFGKILRIDPLGTNGPGGQYGIPVNNPFVGVGGGVREEIYSYGMRNPWRFSFDKRPGGTNRLFCGDVGGDRTEEIDLIVSGGNYGWRYKEGVELPLFSSGAPVNPLTLPPAEVAAMIDPIARYAHPGQTVESPPLPQLGLSVTGGFVYRGTAIPALQGKFVFGDYGSIGAIDGRLMGLEETAPLSGVFTLTQALPLTVANPLTGQRVLTLGEDESGEIYVGLKTNNGVLLLGSDGLPAGGIYKIVNATGLLAASPSQDNSMFREQPNNSSGQGVTLFAGVTNLGDPRRALMAFDLSPVPAGATVSSAQVQLTMSIGQGVNTPMTLNRVTQPWGEGASDAGENGGTGVPAETGDATWNARFYNTNMWTTSGGDYIATASATTAVSSFAAYTWTSAQLAADVQGWLNTPATNNGWILIGDETGTKNAKRVWSREATTASLRPKLTVNYVATPSPSHFEAWLATYFPTNYVGQYVDPNVSFSNDGVGNLVKYAYGLSPLTASPAGTSLQATSATVGPNTVCTYIFRRDMLATDLTYILQTSSDLISWNNIVQSTGGAVSGGPGFVSETTITGQPTLRTVLAQETLSPLTTEYVRLRITRAP